VKRREAVASMSLWAGSVAAATAPGGGEKSMNDVDKLLATRDIMDLKARYFRFVDTHRWEDFQALFAPDATLFFPEGQERPASLGESVTFIKSVLRGTVSVHMGHSPEIEIESPTSAHGIWGMEDKIYWSTEAAAAGGIEFLNGFGHYHEDYVRREGRWLFQRLKLTRLRVDKRSAPRAVE
jgi:hypothetical protein